MNVIVYPTAIYRGVNELAYLVLCEVYIIVIDIYGNLAQTIVCVRIKTTGLFIEYQLIGGTSFQENIQVLGHSRI